MTRRGWTLLGGLVMLAIVASQFNSMRRWTERRGISDELCYLRQAHLFQTRGWQGLDTDLRTETDGFFAKAVRDVGQPDWNAPAQAICHTDMAVTGKRAIQYPPGVGFLLAGFAEGFQAVPVHAATIVLVWLAALTALGYARDRSSALATTAFGCLAIYLMINPAKASYSVPPTAVFCAVAGWLTALLFTTQTSRRRVATIAALGVVLGLSVSFRIPNLLLAAGYGLLFLVTFLATRNVRSLIDGALFGAAYLIGLLPVLAYNAVNAGHPWLTTYGGADVSPPTIDWEVIWLYVADTQGILIVMALAASVWRLGWTDRGRPLQSAAFVVAGNLVVNLGFFLTHPIFTQYYVFPLAMLSLWTLVFDALMRTSDARRSMAAPRPAMTRPVAM